MFVPWPLAMVMTAAVVSMRRSQPPLVLHYFLGCLSLFFSSHCPAHFRTILEPDSYRGRTAHRSAPSACWLGLTRRSLSGGGLLPLDCCGATAGRGGPTRRHSCLSVDHGGEEFGLHELIDSLETLAIPAIAVAGVALVMQQSFQIVSKLVHDREFIEAEACGVAGPRPDHSLSLTFPTSTNASLKEHLRRRKRMFGSLR